MTTMLPMSITVPTKGQSPSASGLDLLFAAASQHSKASAQAVSDCASTVTSFSSIVDVAAAADSPKPIVVAKKEVQPLHHHDQPPLVLCARTKMFFPEVLMNILGSPLFASIITWSPDGKSFIINSRKDFKEKVLPVYFNSNFDSFLRKLKRWGFVKDKSRRQGGPTLEFSHKHFRRDDRSLCLRMRCNSGPVGDSAPAPLMAEDVVCDAAAPEAEAEAQQHQKVVRPSSSFSSLPTVDDDILMRQKKDALVDQLLNQQASQERLLEEINRSSARLDPPTYDQEVRMAEQRVQLMNQRQRLLKKQVLVAAKKAQLASKLADYMAAPHSHPQQTIQDTQRDYLRLSQLQRLGHVLDANTCSSSRDLLNGSSIRTQHSREALRMAILAQRQERSSFGPSYMRSQSNGSLSSVPSSYHGETHAVPPTPMQMQMQPHQRRYISRPDHNMCHEANIRQNFFSSGFTGMK
jgi:arsenate reductase-like glutaredoxin family protein